MLGLTGCGRLCFILTTCATFAASHAVVKAQDRLLVKGDVYEAARITGADNKRRSLDIEKYQSILKSRAIREGIPRLPSPKLFITLLADSNEDVRLGALILTQSILSDPQSSARETISRHGLDLKSYAPAIKLAAKREQSNVVLSEMSQFARQLYAEDRLTTPKISSVLAEEIFVELITNNRTPNPALLDIFLSYINGMFIETPSPQFRKALLKLGQDTSRPAPLRANAILVLIYQRTRMSAEEISFILTLLKDKTQPKELRSAVTGLQALTLNRSDLMPIVQQLMVDQSEDSAMRSSLWYTFAAFEAQQPQELSLTVRLIRPEKNPKVLAAALRALGNYSSCDNETKDWLLTLIDENVLDEAGVIREISVTSIYALDHCTRNNNEVEYLSGILDGTVHSRRRKIIAATLLIDHASRLFHDSMQRQKMWSNTQLRGLADSIHKATALLEDEKTFGGAPPFSVQDNIWFVRRFGGKDVEHETVDTRNYPIGFNWGEVADGMFFDGELLYARVLPNPRLIEEDIKEILSLRTPAIVTWYVALSSTKKILICAAISWLLLWPALLLLLYRFRPQALMAVSVWTRASSKLVNLGSLDTAEESAVLKDIGTYLKYFLFLKSCTRYILFLPLVDCRRNLYLPWVKARRSKAAEYFERFETVSHRKLYLPVPFLWRPPHSEIGIRKESISKVDVSHLLGNASSESILIVISGNGGTGKTSIACQLARFALFDSIENSSTPLLALPVLLENNILTSGSPNIPTSNEIVLSHIHRALRTVLNIDIAFPLTESLLNLGLLLVIFDHYSELNTATQHAINTFVQSGLARLVVITSRTLLPLSHAQKHEILTSRADWQHSDIAAFVDEYLAIKLRQALPQNMLPEAKDVAPLVGRFFEVIHNRPVTVLLVKLYAEYILSVLCNRADISAPRNVAHLMRMYLQNLCRDALGDEDLPDHHILEARIKRDACAIAWACLESNNLSPWRISKANAINVLKSIDAARAEERLEIIHEKLTLLNSDYAAPWVQFSIDPLAEYLGALYFLEQFGENSDAWNTLFGQIEQLATTGASGQGFLQALSDCLEDEGDLIRVPVGVKNRMATTSMRFRAQAA